VPVFLSAADSTAEETLPESVARYATSDLSRFGLMRSLAPTLFAQRPQPSAKWLFLVDGLDEITEPAVRRGVLTKLAGPREAPYCFVVTSRPLPAAELDALDPEIPAYELLPFEPSEVQRFATRWFQTADPATAADRARSFTAAVTDAPGTELACNPLMATMLCQLHSANPRTPLPSGRTDIYARFVALLLERQHQAGVGGVHPQTRMALERRGPTVLARAQHTLDRLPDLLGFMAAETRSGDNRPVAAVLAGHLDAARPEPVPSAVWEEFLNESLRRTGLVGEMGRALEFLHQTISEYCAAAYTCRRPAAGSKALRRTLDSWWRESAPSARPGGRLAATAQSSPHTSFAGFLVDALDPASTTRTLRRLVRRRGLEGCEYPQVRRSRRRTYIANDVDFSTANSRLLGEQRVKFMVGLCEARAILPRTEAHKLENGPSTANRVPIGIKMFDPRRHTPLIINNSTLSRCSQSGSMGAIGG
jgi:hypothetical protein